MGSLGKLKGIRKCKNCGIDVKIYHKDENKLNNCVSNLEWSTLKDNMLYSKRSNKRYHSKNRKKNK